MKLNLNELEKQAVNYLYSRNSTVLAMDIDYIGLSDFMQKPGMLIFKINYKRTINLLLRGTVTKEMQLHLKYEEGKIGEYYARNKTI